MSGRSIRGAVQMATSVTQPAGVDRSPRQLRFADSPDTRSWLYDGFLWSADLDTAHTTVVCPTATLINHFEIGRRALRYYA